MKKRMLGYVLVAGAAVALIVPMIGTILNAQNELLEPAQNEANGDRVVIRVGEETITAKEFNDFVSDLPAHYQIMAEGAGKRMLAEELVQFKLMAAEARRRGLDQAPQTERRLKLLRDQVLASALVEQVQNDLDEDVARAYYEEHREDFEGVRGRHILVTFEGSPVPTRPHREPLTEEQAKARADELRARIEAGENFAEIARFESDDRRTGALGGDLGVFNRGQMVPEFEEVAFAMREGEISQPVRSSFGYHIIHVQEHVHPSLEEVRGEIAQRLGPERMMEFLEELKEKHPAELDEQFFGPPRVVVPAVPVPLEEDDGSAVDFNGDGVLD